MTHKHFICGSLEFTMVVKLNYGLSRTCVSGGVYQSFDTKWGVYYSNWAIWGYRAGVPLGYEIPRVRVSIVVWDFRTSESRVQQQNTNSKTESLKRMISPHLGIIFTSIICLVESIVTETHPASYLLLRCVFSCVYFVVDWWCGNYVFGLDVFHWHWYTPSVLKNQL